MGRLLDLARQADDKRTAVQRTEIALVPDTARHSHCAKADALSEVRRLVEAIAEAAPSYWTAADVEDAVAVAMTDLDNALTTFRALAERYGVGMH